MLNRVKHRRKVSVVSVKLNLEQANNVDRLAPIPPHPAPRRPAHRYHWFTATTGSPLRCVVRTSRLASRLLALRSRSNLKVLVDIPTSQYQRLSVYLSFSISQLFFEITNKLLQSTFKPSLYIRFKILPTFDPIENGTNLHSCLYC